MKRNFLSIFLTVCLLTFSCSGTKENTSNESNQNTEQEEGDKDEDSDPSSNPEPLPGTDIETSTPILSVSASCANNDSGVKDGGWYEVKFEFTTSEENNVTLKRMENGKWMYNSKQIGTLSLDEFNLIVYAEFPRTKTCLVYVPEISDVDDSDKKTISISGDFIVNDGTKDYTVTTIIDIPIAHLDSELVCVDGDNIAIDIQQDNWDLVSDKDKVVAYMDAVYSNMFNLTNVTPFPGKKITYQEWPAHPYWAYVIGDNIVRLNTNYVSNSVKKMDNDQLSFGWTHEMGHSFDGDYGEYYNDGTYTEMQANIKLSYVVEQICTENDKLRMVNTNKNNTIQTGKDYNDDYFLPYCDQYLDSGRAYTTMASDEYHAFYLEVIRSTSWDTMKKFYRVYQQMDKANVAVPSTGTEKVELSFTVLEYCSGLDLSDKFDTWRITISESRRKELIEKYKIEDCYNKI